LLNRGVAKKVKAAHDYYMDEGDKHIAGKISKAFVKENGEYAYYPEDFEEEENEYDEEEENDDYDDNDDEEEEDDNEEYL